MLSNKEEKYYYQIDTLRATMLLLGPVIHSALSFMNYPAGDLWPYKYDRTNLFFDVIVLFLHSFRVPVFFVLAGFFMEKGLRKYSRKVLFIKKLRRIGIPLVFGTLLLYPIIEFGMINAKLGSVSIYDFFDYFDISHYKFAHLWFLYYLLVFYFVHIIVSGFLNGLREWVLDKNFVQLTLIIVALMIASFFILIFIDHNAFDGDYALLPHIGSVLYFIFFYFMGFVAYNSNRWFGYLRNYFILYFIVGAISFILLLASRAGARVVETDFSIVESLLFVISAYSFVWGFFGMFEVLLRKNRLVAYIAKSSYFIYIVHLPVLTLVLALTVSFQLNEFSLFGIIFTATIFISYLLYFVASVISGYIVKD